MKIKLSVWCEGFMPENFSDDGESDDNFDNFVENEVNKNKLLQSFEKDHPLNKMESIEFEVPDDLSEQLIFDICYGKSCNMWFEYQIDFYQDYYQYWVFVEKDGKWEGF